MANSLNDFINKLKRKIQNYPPNKELRKVAEGLNKKIIKRTKLGFGVNKSGEQRVKLKDIQEKTKLIRKELKRRGKLASDASPSKSQVYRSGSMLGNTKAKVETKGFSIEPSDSKNKKKAKSLDESGFKWLNVSDTELKALLEDLDDALQKELDLIR